MQFMRATINLLDSRDVFVPILHLYLYMVSVAVSISISIEVGFLNFVVL